MIRGTPARAGLGSLIAAGVCWGTSGTLGTLLTRVSGLPLLAVAGYRIGVGAVLIAAVIGAARRFRAPRRASGWSRVAGMAACSALYQIGFFLAIGRVGVALSTLVAIGSAPILVLIVDAATGRHRIDLRLAATFVLALSGLVLLSGTPPVGVGAGQLLWAILLALLAGAGFAGISLIGARPEPDFDDATGTALAFALGGMVVFAVAAVTGPVGFAPTPVAVALVVALGLIPTAVAYLSYLRGLRFHTSTTGVLVSLLEPLTASVLAVVVLSERLSFAAMTGAALLLGSVVLATTGPQPNDTSPLRD